MAENQTMSSWDRIRQGVADVENLMDQKQYNLSMVRGRQTLEYMINYLAQSVRLQAPDMSTAVDELYNMKVISAQSRENYHNIRSLGNRAAHEGNNSAADAAASYQMLSREVYAFADAYAKAARQIGQMIRNGQSIPTRGASTGAASARSSSGTYTAARTQASAGGGATTATTRLPNAGAYSANRTPGTGTQGRATVLKGEYTLNTEPEIGLARNRSTTSSYAGTARGQQNEGYRSTRSTATGARTSSAGARNTSSAGNRSSSGGSSSARRTNRSSATIAGVSPEIILKIMIPIILVILLIAVIKFATSKHSTETAEETSAVEVTESVQETMQVVTAAAIPVETTQAPTEPETTAAPEYKYTTTDSLRVRTAPGTDAGIVEVLAAGTEVTFIEQVDDKWAKISYNGSEAYVAAEYLKKEQVQ